MDLVEGSNLNRLPWGDSPKTNCNLFSVDGPKLILFRSYAGQRYLGWWNDSDTDSERWIYQTISSERLRRFGEGRIDSLEAITEPEDGWIVVVDYSSQTGEPITIIQTTPNALDRSSLPVSGAKLPLPRSPEAILLGAEFDLADIVEIGLPGDKESSAELTSRTVGTFQRLLDAIGEAILFGRGGSGRIPVKVIEVTRLATIGTLPGSLYVVLGIPHTQWVELSRESIKAMLTLLKVDSTSLDDYLSIRTDRVRRRVHELTRVFRLTRSQLSINWVNLDENSSIKVDVTAQNLRWIMDWLLPGQTETQQKLIPEFIRSEDFADDPTLRSAEGLSVLDRMATRSRGRFTLIDLTKRLFEARLVDGRVVKGTMSLRAWNEITKIRLGDEITLGLAIHPDSRDIQLTYIDLA